MEVARSSVSLCSASFASYTNPQTDSRPCRGQDRRTRRPRSFAHDPQGKFPRRRVVRQPRAFIIVMFALVAEPNDEVIAQGLLVVVLAAVVAVAAAAVLAQHRPAFRICWLLSSSTYVVRS